MTDIEPTAAQVAAVAIRDKWISDAEKAKLKLAEFATNLPTSDDFKQAGGQVVYELFVQMVNGELKPRNLDEATKSAQRIIEIVAGVELMELGRKVAASDNPQETLAALTREAESRMVAKP